MHLAVAPVGSVDDADGVEGLEAAFGLAGLGAAGAEEVVAEDVVAVGAPIALGAGGSTAPVTGSHRLNKGHFGFAAGALDAGLVAGAADTAGLAVVLLAVTHGTTLPRRFLQTLAGGADDCALAWPAEAIPSSATAMSGR